MISAEFVASCILYALEHPQGPTDAPPDPESKLSYLSRVEEYSSRVSSDSPPHSVSKAESVFYYSGLSPTPPRLVYRTGNQRTPWFRPEGFEAYRKLKHALGVFGHKLNNVWNEQVGPLVRDALNTHKIPWTSIAVARFLTDGDGGGQILSPVVIWVGVRPNALLAADAFGPSNVILDILAAFDIHDVEVEYRESLYKRSAGPVLLRSVSDLRPTVDIRGPLTPTLGLHIAAFDEQDAQGTMALYFAEGGDSDKILGLTCRHVLFQTEKATNDDYCFPGGDAPRKNVWLLGTRSFDNLLNSIKWHIGCHAITVDGYIGEIAMFEEKLRRDNKKEPEDLKVVLQKTQKLLAKTNNAIEELERFYEQVKKDWSEPTQRIIGHIRTSPALASNAGRKGFTEDWGVFELDGDKFRDAFRGNFIDLGVFQVISMQVIQRT